MRKAINWFGFVMVALVGIFLLVLLGVTLYGQLTFKQALERPVYEISADMSPEGIARGEYLVRNVMACSDCHSQEQQNPNLAGSAEEIVLGPVKALFAAPNLTNDPETGLGRWSDGEIARAIREGVDKDGRELLIMPSMNYHEMSDSDTAAIVGYLRSIEPVFNPVPEIEVNWIGKALLAAGLFPKSVEPAISEPVQAPSADSVKYGRYLVVLGGCRDCHGEHLDGTAPMNGPVGGEAAPNITGSGILASWSESDFVHTIRSGVTPTGRQLSEAMPWKVYAGMTDEDLQWIYRYLSQSNVQSASQNQPVTD